MLTSEVRAHNLVHCFWTCALTFLSLSPYLHWPVAFHLSPQSAFSAYKGHLPLQENQMGVIFISKTIQEKKNSYILALRNLWQNLRTNFLKDALLVLGFQEIRPSSSAHSNEWCLQLKLKVLCHFKLGSQKQNCKMRGYKHHTFYFFSLSNKVAQLQIKNGNLNLRCSFLCLFYTKPLGQQQKKAPQAWPQQNVRLT